MKIENAEIVASGLMNSKDYSEKFLVLTVVVSSDKWEDLPQGYCIRKVRIETIDASTVVDPPKENAPTVEATGEPIMEAEEDAPIL